MGNLTSGGFIFDAQRSKVLVAVCEIQGWSEVGRDSPKASKQSFKG